MGMFDTFVTKCPNCHRELEFQSKTGPCILAHFTEENLPTIVASGIDGDIVKCEFCEINWELTCELPKVVKTKLRRSEKEKSYSGNYNPKLEENIKRMEELKKMMSQ